METEFYWYTVCVFALFLKMFALSCYQGLHRISNLAFNNPEDANFFNKSPVTEQLPQVKRATKAWQNDLENIPVFWVLGAIYVLVDASAKAEPILFITFTAARMVHTLAYLYGLQPWRFLAYITGVSCLFLMCYQIFRVLVG